MLFSLLQLTNPDLTSLATGNTPKHLEVRLEADALPPPFVSARALALAQAGHAAPWSTPFLIVRTPDQRIVGGCGFKSAPSHGRVDVGYGIAPSAQGQGAATLAVSLLLARAFNAGANEVLAEILPGNSASIRVVEKLGFTPGATVQDKDGDWVVQWVKTRPALDFEENNAIAPVFK